MTIFMYSSGHAAAINNLSSFFSFSFCVCVFSFFGSRTIKYTKHTHTQKQSEREMLSGISHLARRHSSITNISQHLCDPYFLFRFEMTHCVMPCKRSTTAAVAAAVVSLHRLDVLRFFHSIVNMEYRRLMNVEFSKNICLLLMAHGSLFITARRYFLYATSNEHRFECVILNIVGEYQLEFYARSVEHNTRRK